MIKGTIVQGNHQPCSEIEFKAIESNSVGASRREGIGKLDNVDGLELIWMTQDGEYSIS